MAPSLKGKLLVATPALTDPSFRRAVVLVLEHDDSGAVGVILNRPGAVEVEAPLGAWRRFASEPPVVFEGGPVAPDAAICVARTWPGERAAHWEAVLGTVGVLDLSIDPDLVAATVAAIRVFAGYAGWGPAQLEAEVDEAAWWVIDAAEGDALSPEPDDLWAEVLRRQGGELALFAFYPPDPALN